MKDILLKITRISTSAFILMLLFTCVVFADSQGWGLSLLTNPSDPNSSTMVSLASMYGYSMGQDSIERPITTTNPAEAAWVCLWKESEVQDWNGEVGWYSEDYRPKTKSGTVIFDSIYVWGNSGYTGNTIQLGYYWFAGVSNPSNWIFTLTMVQTPDGQFPEKTSWTITPSAMKTQPVILVTLPTYNSTDGTTAYKFELTAEVVPEPSVLVSLATLVFGTTMLRRRR